MSALAIHTGPCVCNVPFVPGHAQAAGAACVLCDADVEAVGEWPVFAHDDAVPP